MSTSGTQACLACQMPDPPPEMTCTLGRDHRVGLASGCPRPPGPAPARRGHLA